jgi:hypothetical protein
MGRRVTRVWGEGPRGVGRGALVLLATALLAPQAGRADGPPVALSALVSSP